MVKLNLMNIANCEQNTINDNNLIVCEDPNFLIMFVEARRLNVREITVARRIRELV